MMNVLLLWATVFFPITVGIQKNDYVSNDFPLAKSMALSQEKLLIVGFTADWCTPCQIMKEYAWTDPAVQSYCSENCVVVFLDVDDSEGGLYSQQYEVRSFPTTLVINTKGEVVAKAEKAFTAQMLLAFIQENDKPEHRKKSLPVGAISSSSGNLTIPASAPVSDDEPIVIEEINAHNSNWLGDVFNTSSENQGLSRPTTLVARPSVSAYGFDDDFDENEAARYPEALPERKFTSEVVPEKVSISDDYADSWDNKERESSVVNPVNTSLASSPGVDLPKPVETAHSEWNFEDKELIAAVAVSDSEKLDLVPAEKPNLPLKNKPVQVQSSQITAYQSTKIESKPIIPASVSKPKPSEKPIESNEVVYLVFPPTESTSLSAAPSVETTKTILAPIVGGGNAMTYGYTLQVGAFHRKSNAKTLFDKLFESFDVPMTIQTPSKGDKFHRVWLGKFESKAEADALKSQLAKFGINQVYVRQAAF